MIQVDPERSLRTYVNLTDPQKSAPSVHEVVRGLTPKETLKIIRDALVAEMRRRATEARSAG